jgi:hypothetical protein
MDVTIEDLGANLALNFVDVALLQFARSDFLTALGPAADKHLTLGRLFWPSGEQLQGFHVLGSTSTLTIRGGPRSRREFCPTCGVLQYYAIGRSYLLRTDLTGQPLYFSDECGGLIATNEIAARLRRHMWAKVRIYEIAVRDKPMDGLPLDLGEIKPSDLE